jgi:enoyl-CoA hydratase/carnithine racemase
MTNEDVLIADRRGSALWLTLNRPEAMNSLSPEMIARLSAELDNAEQDESVRCVVITGVGRAFCAGADLSFALDALDDTAGFLDFLDDLGKEFRRLAAFPKPVIAAIGGIAMAGGLELAMCCDMIFASESARIADAHANYGLLPGAGGAVRLPRIVGPARAKRLLFTGAMIPAAELVAAGLVNEVVPDDQLEEVVMSTVREIETKSPLGLRRMKELVESALDQPIEQGLRAEILALAAHLHSHDLAEGLCAFREKRRPNFEGR